MKRTKLTVQKRDILGKKVKKLRKEGFVPANIYGKGIESLAVQIPVKDFDAVFKEAGETGLIDVEVDGQLRPALIHNVQVHPVTHSILHADLYQVNLKEKVKTMVPVTLVGEAKAVTDKVGIVMQPLSEVEVEALPEDLPDQIEVNVEHLAAIDEQITITDLKLPQGVTVLTDGGQVVAKVAELVTKEAQEEAAAAEAAAEAAKAETAEGESSPVAEGETQEKGDEKPQEAAKEQPAEEGK